MATWFLVGEGGFAGETTRNHVQMPRSAVEAVETELQSFRFYHVLSESGPATASKSKTSCMLRAIEMTGHPIPSHPFRVE